MKKIIFCTMMLANIFANAQIWYPRARTVDEYTSPSQSVASLGYATTILQQRYDNNVRRVQNAVTSISNQIRGLNTSEQRADNILGDFNAKCVTALNNSGTRNYSRDDVADYVINWLYDCANVQIKNN